MQFCIEQKIFCLVGFDFYVYCRITVLKNRVCVSLHRYFEIGMLKNILLNCFAA